MQPLGEKYFALFQYVPLRPFHTEDEYLEAAEFGETLHNLADHNQLGEDETTYLQVLDLLLDDFEEMFEGTDMDDEEIFEPVICEEQFTEVDAVTDNIKELLDAKQQELHEWDFVALCNNIQTAVSRKLSELEPG